MARVFALLSLLMLAACSQAGNPPEVPVTPAATAFVAVAADTPVATIAAPPTATPIPTGTPVPAPQMTATPTGTPSPVSSPTATPTETPTPTPTSEFACRPAEEVAAFRSPYQVVAGPWPRPAAFNGELYVGNGTANIIHLGFDVEGSPAPLAEILDILDRRGVKTTMYVLGSWADTYPGWVAELARRGHEMANHAYSHANLKDLEAAAILAELEHTENVIMNLTGQSTKPWFRPPFGSRSDVVIEAAFSGGWTTVVWSGSAEDWREEANADLMCQTMREGSFPGSILYAHTNHPDMPETIDRYIGEMQSRGYTFVPLSVMMSGDPGAWLVSP